MGERQEGSCLLTCVGFSWRVLWNRIGKDYSIPRRCCSFVDKRAVLQCAESEHVTCAHPEKLKGGGAAAQKWEARGVRYCVASRSAPSGDHDNDARAGRTAGAGRWHDWRSTRGICRAKTWRPRHARLTTAPVAIAAALEIRKEAEVQMCGFFTRRRKGRFSSSWHLSRKNFKRFSILSRWEMCYHSGCHDDLVFPSYARLPWLARNDVFCCAGNQTTSLLGKRTPRSCCDSLFVVVLSWIFHSAPLRGWSFEI